MFFKKESSPNTALRILGVPVVAFLFLSFVVGPRMLSAHVSFTNIEKLGNEELSNELSVSLLDELPQQLKRPADSRVGSPVKILIPSIEVNADIEKVHLTSAGAMAVPTHPLDVGWYALGARPGEIGTATVAGHVDWFNGATAVFADLHKVKSGDTITVQDDEGSTISFVVRKIRRYNATDKVTNVFTSQDGKSHLNLITCDGAWDKKANQYEKRLVVFAEREDAQ